MSCIVCNKELPSGSKFCKFCGSKQSNLQDNSLTAQVTQSAKCTKCDASLIFGAKFCKFCGEPIAAKNISMEIKRQPGNDELLKSKQQENPASVEILIPETPKLLTGIHQLKNEQDEPQVDISIAQPIQVGIKKQNSNKFTAFFLVILMIVGGALFFIFDYPAKFEINTDAAVKITPSSNTEVVTSPKSEEEKKVSDCVVAKTAAYRKFMGEDALVKFDILDEWSEECKKSQVATIVDDTPFAPSFDCNKASNDAERLICSDRELSKFDVELNQTYSKARVSAPDKEKLKSDQLAWVESSRNACLEKICMADAYKQRIAEISK